MPGIDSHVFSYALTGFLIFGAANLTIELIIAFVLSCKKLKATILTRYDLESGKLKPSSSTPVVEIHQLDAAILSRVLALSPADRQVIRSLLDTLSGPVSLDVVNGTTREDAANQPEDLYFPLPIARKKVAA